MKAHVDWPWSPDVREYGAPMRVYVTTKNWFIMAGAKSQRWDSEFGWTREWRIITRSPRTHRRCRAFLEHHVECPLLKEHDGRHWNWKRGWKQTEVASATEPAR